MGNDQITDHYIGIYDAIEHAPGNVNLHGYDILLIHRRSDTNNLMLYLLITYSINIYIYIHCICIYIYTCI